MNSFQFLVPVFFHILNSPLSENTTLLQKKVYPEKSFRDPHTEKKTKKRNSYWKSLIMQIIFSQKILTYFI